MCALLTPAEESEPAAPGAAGARVKDYRDGLLVHGVRYTNSAAKFWAALIDEAVERFPECDRLLVSTFSSARLESGLLYPTLAFERDLERLLLDPHAPSLSEIAGQLELLGPPSPVRIRLFDESGERLARELPADCLDAEILAYLIAWLLSWSGVPPERWNDASTSGQVNLEDLRSKTTYRLRFTLGQRHLSEGLFEQTLAADYGSTDSAATGNTTAP